MQRTAQKRPTPPTTPSVSRNRHQRAANPNLIKRRQTNPTGSPNTYPACLTVARVHPVKNHRMILEALALLAQSRPQVHWHMVGSADDLHYLQGLRATSERLGVSESVTWHGHRNDAEALMLDCDVTVLASRSEGVPRAIQEAMALGVPTVMPAGLAPDLEGAGLPILYRSQHPRALARAIETAMIADPVRLAYAAQWVTQRWSRDVVLRDWESILAHLAPS
ncbi:MAG: glycosyltransferase [Pseudonocardiaceae bacterium]